MKVKAILWLVTICAMGLAASGAGCVKAQTQAQSDTFCEVRTVPGYPRPGEPVAGAELYRVAVAGQVTCLVNGSKSGEARLSADEMAALDTLLRDLPVQRDPPVTVDAASTVLTVYRNGKAIGSAVALRDDADAMPNGF